jgi:putative oxidoreductase
MATLTARVHADETRKPAVTLTDHYRSLRSVGHTIAKQLTWLPPLATRVALGYVFIESGWGKLAHMDKVIQNFVAWGIPAAQVLAPFSATCELVFGALLLVGLFTRFAAVPLMIIMIVAMRATAYDPNSAATQGTLSYLFGLMEYLYLLLLAWLAVHGAGTASIDRFIRHDTTT